MLSVGDLVEGIIIAVPYAVPMPVIVKLPKTEPNVVASPGVYMGATACVSCWLHVRQLLS